MLRVENSFLLDYRKASEKQVCTWPVGFPAGLIPSYVLSKHCMQTLSKEAKALGLGFLWLTPEC